MAFGASVQPFAAVSGRCSRVLMLVTERNRRASVDVADLVNQAGQKHDSEPAAESPGVSLSRFIVPKRMILWLGSDAS